MKIVAIIEARMSSTRLPNKSMKKIVGKPLLELMIERIKHCNKIIVLKKGKIIQQGNHNNLINKHGYYNKLYKKQNTENEI